MALENLLNLLQTTCHAKLSDIVRTMQDFELCMNAKSASINEYLNNSLIENEITREIKQIKWRISDKIVAFSSNTTWLNEEAIIQKMNERLEI